MCRSLPGELNSNKTGREPTPTKDDFLHKSHKKQYSSSSTTDTNNEMNIYSRFKNSVDSRSYSASPVSISSSSQYSRSLGRPSGASTKGAARNSKLPRSALHTPVISMAGNLFSGLIEPEKCDHRLKLHYSMKVFGHQNEEFLCQLNVSFSIFVMSFYAFYSFPFCTISSRQNHQKRSMVE